MIIYKSFERRKIYRSIKPENMMVVKVKEKPIAYKAGEPRILDVGERGLAMAVIMQAWMDADFWKDTTNRRHSRMFLTAQTKDWRESLEFWCWLSGFGAKGVIDKARRLYWDEKKIELYKRLGK